MGPIHNHIMPRGKWRNLREHEVIIFFFTKKGNIFFLNMRGGTWNLHTRNRIWGGCKILCKNVWISSTPPPHKYCSVPNYVQMYGILYFFIHIMTNGSWYKSPYGVVSQAWVAKLAFCYIYVKCSLESIFSNIIHVKCTSLVRNYILEHYTYVKHINIKILHMNKVYLK